MIKFRARISEQTIIIFTLEDLLVDLIDGKPLFFIRELLIPWLKAGNIPDRWMGKQDSGQFDIYENDVLEIPVNNGNAVIEERENKEPISLVKGIVGFVNGTFCLLDLTTKKPIILWDDGQFEYSSLENIFLTTYPDIYKYVRIVYPALDIPRKSSVIFGNGMENQIKVKNND